MNFLNHHFQTFEGITFCCFLLKDLLTRGLLILCLFALYCQLPVWKCWALRGQTSLLLLFSKKSSQRVAHSVSQPNQSEVIGFSPLWVWLECPILIVWPSRSSNYPQRLLPTVGDIFTTKEAKLLCQCASGILLDTAGIPNLLRFPTVLWTHFSAFAPRGSYLSVIGAASPRYWEQITYPWSKPSPMTHCCKRMEAQLHRGGVSRHIPYGIRQG